MLVVLVRPVTSTVVFVVRHLKYRVVIAAGGLLRGWVMQTGTVMQTLQLPEEEELEEEDGIHTIEREA
jgi:hypothetical protein